MNNTSKRATLEALNLEMLELTPEDQLEDEVEKADEYFEKILSQISKVLLKSRTHMSPSRTVPHLLHQFIRLCPLVCQLPLLIHRQDV